MKAIELRLHNFWSYLGDHVFYIDNRGLVCVMGRTPEDPAANSNGSGKSGLFIALDWCLFGVVPTGDAVDSLIHDDAKECWVECLLRDDDGTEGVIRRGRPTSLSFILDGQAPRDDRDQELDPKETQKVIERWLGLDRDVFHSTVLHAQGNLVRYADRTDAGRMEILTKIIPELFEVDALLAPAKSRRDEVKTSLDRVVTEKTGLEGEIRGLQAIDYTVQAAAWENTRKTQLQEAQGRLQGAQAALAEAGGTAEGLAAAQAQLAEFEASPPIQAPPSTTAKIQEAEGAIASESANIRNLKSCRATAAQEISAMQTRGAGTCSQCGQIVTAAHLQAEVQKLSSYVAERDSLLVGSQRELERWGPELERRRLALRKIGDEIYALSRAAAENIAQARVGLEHMQKAEREAAGHQASILVVEKQIEGIHAQQNPVAEQEKVRDRKVLQYQTRFAQLEDFERRGVKALEIAIFWVVALGHDGLKSYILDSKLEELDESCNYWVRLLTGGTTWVRFASQKSVDKGKRKKNAPSIRIFRWRSDGKIIERNFKSLSFGQKERVGRGIDIGLSQLLARRATKKWDLLALDEIFNHVDAKGAELVGQMLHELKAEKSSIFVIHHNADFQGQFEDQTIVEMRCGSSKIIEGAYGEEKETEGSNRGRDPAGEPPKSKGAAGDGGLPARAPIRRGIARRAQQS